MCTFVCIVTCISSLMQQVWIQEMSEGLFGDVTNGDGADKLAQEEGAEQSIPLLKRPVRAEDRKTRQQRRKERLRREEERRRRLEKLEKVRSQAIYSLRSVKREMRDKEEKMQENIKRRQQEKEQAVFSTKRLGRYAYLLHPPPSHLHILHTHTHTPLSSSSLLSLFFLL